MVRLNEIGKQCPIPVIETKKVIENLEEGELVEVLVDNEIASQNLRKFAEQRGYEYACELISDHEYRVKLTVTERAKLRLMGGERSANEKKEKNEKIREIKDCGIPSGKAGKKSFIVVISSDSMGEGEKELGKILLKGFLYALARKEDVPRKVIFYNGGAKLSCEGSDSLEDLLELQKNGCEILTCGTCLKFQGLEDHLQVGGVTNMYDITEALTGEDIVVKPC